MRLTDLLSIDHAVIQAPMAGAQRAELAIAVCQAGGLGSLPCAMLAPEVMRRDLEKLHATRRAYNVNFFCHDVPVSRPEQEARWRATLAVYYKELGVDPPAEPPTPSRAPFSAEAADVLEPFAPPVVSFHFGLPSPELVARVKRWGSKVISSATTVSEGRWLEAQGVDAIIAQGLEAGGHRGHFLSDELQDQLPLAALLPQLLEAVKVPVIAAGGIADAEGAARTMSLGAAGVQVGSAYLLCPEAAPRAEHRAALEASPRTTAITNLFTGRPARGIVNRLMRELGPMSTLPPAFPLAASALAPLRAAAEARGTSDFSPLWCGEHAGGYRQLSATALTAELASAVSGRAAPAP